MTDEDNSIFEEAQLIIGMKRKCRCQDCMPKGGRGICKTGGAI